MGPNSRIFIPEQGRAKDGAKEGVSSMWLETLVPLSMRVVGYRRGNVAFG